jgi:hypothetical protein
MYLRVLAIVGGLLSNETIKDFLNHVEDLVYVVLLT